jgi:hypothetical protein
MYHKAYQFKFNFGSKKNKTPSTEKRKMWVECSKCGQRQCLGIGYNQEFISKEKINDLLRQIGWQTLPKLKCGKCKTK